MWHRLGVERSELRIFVWGAATLFLTGWAEVSVQNAAEVYFNKRVGPDHLPEAFLLSMALLVPTTYALGRRLARRDRLQMLPLVLAGLALSLLPLWLLVRWNVTSGFWLLIIGSKQLDSMALLAFWVAMNDLLHGRQAKRLFAPLMAGLTLGAISGSFASDPIGRTLGMDALLPVSAVALALAAFMALGLRRGAPARLRRRARRKAPTRVSAVDGMAAVPEEGRALPSIPHLWRESWLFRLLFVAMMCAGLLGPMLYFQFQYVANLATQGATGESDLLKFYSQFRGWIHLGILFAQLAATSSLYRRIGVPLAAALSPLIYLIGFLGLSLRLNLPAGVGAMAATKLQDNAVYDPAMRVLYNLFPDALRSRAGALLEGPIKRSGGALGNLLTLIAIQVGTASWVGYAALPIAAFWLVAAVVLWWSYPQLLMEAPLLRRGQPDEGLSPAELLDRATLRGLHASLIDSNADRRSIATALVCEAEPELAVSALTGALREAPEEGRSVLVGALDAVLEAAVTRPVTSRRAARLVAELLDEAPELSAIDRANLIQAYGRLTLAQPTDESALRLEGAVTDSEPAVRLAAAVALQRRGLAPGGVRDVDDALRAAIANDDPAERQIAREELRNTLLLDSPDEVWDRRLQLLARLLASEEDRAATAEALAEIAERHPERVARVTDAMLALRDERDPRAIAALARFVGRAGLSGEAAWLVEQVVSPSPAVADAAREALRAMGPEVADVLLKELSYGTRSKRDAVLPIVRELDCQEETLRALLHRELDAVRQTLVRQHVLEATVSPLVSQRLEERVEEGVHTTLLLLAAIHEDERLEELAERLTRARGARQRAILLEALDAILGAREASLLLPLLDDRSLAHRGAAAAAALGVPIPTAAQAVASLTEDPDDLTRTLARNCDLEDHDDVLNPAQIAVQLKALPLFQDMTTRQLLDLAKVVREVEHPADFRVVREGDYDECMFLIVEGSVEVRKGDTVLASLHERDFFGEAAVLEGTTRNADVVTCVPTRLLCLQRDDLFRIMEELPSIAISICRALSQRVRGLNERLQQR